MIELDQQSQKDIERYAVSMGVPESLLPIYLQVVAFEWGMNEPHHQEYALLIDFSSPDYRNAIEAQNQRLKHIRAGLESTELGQKTIAHIPKDIDDGTTIPYPKYSKIMG